MSKFKYNVKHKVKNKTRSVLYDSEGKFGPIVDIFESENEINVQEVASDWNEFYSVDEFIRCELNDRPDLKEIIYNGSREL